MIQYQVIAIAMQPCNGSAGSSFDRKIAQIFEMGEARRGCARSPLVDGGAMD